MSSYKFSRDTRPVDVRWKDAIADATSNQLKSANHLRDLAIKYESNDIELAIFFMDQALKLKPTGSVIKDKLTDYAQFIQEAQALASIKQDKKKYALYLLEKFKQDSIELWHNVNPKPWFRFVIAPWLLVTLYFIFWASDRFESTSQLIVKQPDGMATLSPELNLLSGLGVGGGEPDAQLVEAYIHSYDMLEYLVNEMAVQSHYIDSRYDFFSRLSRFYTREDLLEYFRELVTIEVDDTSIITIKSQGFEPDFARLINEKIIERAEWFINEIGHNLAEKQLAFIQGEHDIAVDKLEQSKANLLSFQQKHDLLDPESEGAALQSITYGLESEVAKKKAHLTALQDVMSADSLDVRIAENELSALVNQLKIERNRLAQHEGENESVGEILALYSALKLDLELASQAYSSSLVSLEKSRIEAYRQLKYLVVIQNATLPEGKAYPQVIKNSFLLFVLLSLLYGIASIVIATYKELK